MHMVVFTTAEGRPGYYQTETLEDAVKFIERLRNTEQVDDAKLYRMSEVPLQVKTYVKVEVAGSETPPVALVEAEEPAPVSAPANSSIAGY